jgi:ribonuclease BN (tRNA processing enzyme)
MNLDATREVYLSEGGRAYRDRGVKQIRAQFSSEMTFELLDSVSRSRNSDLFNILSQDLTPHCSQRLWQNKVPMGKIDYLILTHLYSDHVVGIPDLWLTGWLCCQTSNVVSSNIT